MSPLRNHEILFGKLFARMAHLGGILLASLPILSLAQLWGGVDMATLVLNFVNTFFNLLTVGCFSMLVSVLMRRTLTAVMTIYGVMLPFLLIFAIIGLGPQASTPFGFWQFDTGTAAVSIVLFFLHLLVSTLSLVMAHVFLRRPSELPPRWQEPPRAARVGPRVRQNAPERTIRVVRDFHVPPVTNEPLLWKEYYFGPRPHTHIIFWLLSTVFLFAPLGLGIPFSLVFAGAHEGRSINVLGWMCRIAAIVCALLYVLWCAFRSAGSIVRERQNKTLDELLTIPIDRTTILGYKWLGSALHGWVFAAYFGVIVFFGMVTTGLHPAASILLAGSVLIHAFFWTTLGLYYSVVCRTVLSAYLRLGLTLLGVIMATVMYAGIVDFNRDDWTGYFLACGLNPLASWWVFGFTSFEYRHFEVSKPVVGGCLAGVLIYLLMTASLWLLCYGKFQRERYRHME